MRDHDALTADLEPGDLGNVRALIESHGSDLRYVTDLGWFYWDGTCWRHDPDDTARVREYAKATARRLYDTAKRFSFEQANDAAERIRRAQRSHDAARLNAMVRMAQSEEAVLAKPEDFDRDVWLFNAANGVLDLRTAELRAHRREDLITKLAPVAYDPEAPCPRFEAFISQIMGGDSELIAFLQRLLGYALAGDRREQVLAIFYGTGSNGKSTLLTALRDVMGDYARHTASETFLIGRNGAIPPDLYRLRGARLVTAAEAEAGKRLAESLIKQLTGGDPILVKKLYCDPFEIVPQFLPVLATNHKPIIAGTDHAIWRRLRLIPFAVTIPDEEQDKALPDKLRAEYPGVLRWLVEGCLAWLREGLEPPKAVREATAEYRSEQDVLADFLTQRCRFVLTGRVGKADLVRAYREWCATTETIPLASAFITRTLRTRGLREASSGGRDYWKGLELIQPG